MEQLAAFIQSPFFNKALTTIFMLFIIIGIRIFMVRRLNRRNDLTPIQRRQYIVSVQNAALFLFILMVIVIWLEQLRTIAATLMVIAAALVLATKEFILNISGFFFRSSADFISIGDRIEINGIRGDVIDQTILGITLLEIGPGVKTNQYTGLTVFIPNSMFLSNPVRNETHLWGNFVFHLITIPLKIQANWEMAEKALLEAARESCDPYIGEAKTNMEELARRHSLDTPAVEPRVHFQIVEPDKALLVLRIPVPARKRGKIEQDISRRYLQLMGDHLVPVMEPNPACPASECK
jgi:small-conductance mechanosensitive channel